MSIVNPTRATVLGKLIRSAREHAGRSVNECARVLGKTDEQFSGAEEGQFIFSLPDLEVLAMYLRVPMSHFWGDQSPPDEAETDYAAYAALRQRIIGALLGHARLQSGHSTQELADAVDLNTEQIEAYESGHVAIPYFELEMLAGYLDLPVRTFTDEQRGPLARLESEQRMWQRFEQLSPEVKAFVVEPINLSYLETAMRLSELDVDKLREIAENILEITL